MVGRVGGRPGGGGGVRVLQGNCVNVGGVLRGNKHKKGYSRVIMILREDSGVISPPGSTPVLYYQSDVLLMSNLQSRPCISNNPQSTSIHLIYF